MIEQLWVLQNHLRQLIHGEFGGQWAETVTLIQASLADAPTRTQMASVFSPELSASQLTASLAYLASVESPRESRLTPTDVALLLWLNRPYHHANATFTQGLQGLLQLGKFEARFFSLSEEFTELDRKKFERLNQSLSDWLPLFIFGVVTDQVETNLRVA